MENMSKRIIGVISDTHGLLRPEALEALRGSELIIHAGDVGSQVILRDLEELAPVVAIRGNIDKAKWASILPEREVVELGDHTLYMLHDLKTLDLDPVLSGFSAVISGHSHRPGIEWRKGVLYLNPGSAGPRRFNLPVTIARLTLGEEKLEASLVELEV